MRIKASEVQLVTIPNIPVLEAGVEWQLGTGPFTPTVTDLEDAISAANEDPTFRSPRLKLGHVEGGWQASDGSTSGEPAFGQFANLRLSANGYGLVADMINVPLWLAEIMPSAYPNRSFEGKQDYETNAGKKYRLVLTAVSLLGVEMPGIGSLDDLHQLFTNPQIEFSEGVYTLSVQGKAVKAQIDADDVKRAFYNDFATGDKYWWWIRAVRLDPNEIIVDDEDNGQLYRVPFTVNDRAVSFGDPQAVYISYVDDHTVPQEDKAAVAASWKTAADSRPSERSNLDPKALRAAIGLSENATDDEVKARLEALGKVAAQTPPSEVPPPEDEGDDEDDEEEEEDKPAEAAPEAQGPVLVDAEALASLRADAAMGKAAREEQINESRETLLAEAVKDGKFPPSRKDHFRKLLKADDHGTRELITSLEPNVVPVDARGGADPETDMAGSAADDSYPEGWLTPAEQAAVKARKGQT